MTRARDLAAFVSNADGDIKFDTDTLFIDSSANRVGIGRTDPAHPLDIQNDSASRHLRVFRNASGTSAIMVQNSDTGSGSSDGLQLSVISGGDAQVANLENTNLRFLTNSTERMRILAGGGLTFNGDTAAANALNDYEEGTWTPNVRGSTTAGSFSGSNIVGWYTKVGDMITAWFDADGTVSGASGNIEITGLPFTSLSGGPEAVGVFMRDGMQTDGTAQDLNLYVPQGQTYMNIFQSFDNSAWTVLGTTNETIGIRGNVTYKTA